MNKTSGIRIATVDLETGEPGDGAPLRSLKYAPAKTRGETVLARVRERASAGGGWLDLATPGEIIHACYVCDGGREGEIGEMGRADESGTAVLAGHPEVAA